VLLRRNKWGVRRVIRREEERAVRQLLEAVDVPETSPEPERREGRDYDYAEEGALHRC
jgi:hypothetical protein